MLSADEFFGSNIYFDLEVLKLMINPEIYTENIIKILVDGVEIFKNFKHNFWPILMLHNKKYIVKL